MSWQQFGQYLPNVTEAAQGSDVDVVTINAPAGASARNVQELQQRLEASGGSLVVDSNSSLYIVAINNSARFTVTRRPDGRFVITKSNTYLYLVAAVVVVGALLFIRSNQ